MPEANDILLKYNWPGNIRELENMIQRGVVLAKDEIGAEIIPFYPFSKGGWGI